MVLKVFQSRNEQMEALVNSEYSAGTLERYKTSLPHTRAFIRWKYDVEDFEINKLDFAFV